MNSEFRIQNIEVNGLGQFSESGYEVLANVVPENKCDALAIELSVLYQRQKEKAKNKLGGLRNLLRMVPCVDELANSRKFKDILKMRLNRTFFPVRAIFFDKTADANWRVAWHQDLTIAVAEKIETPEFEAWSIKEDIVHVQPPRRILDGMATIRLHLDDCNADNGALKVIAGSHSEGRLNADQIRECTHEEKISVCEVPRGGALLMRPLLLHSSPPSRNPSHRRVLHIEYASDELPNGLKWFYC
jgi:ectoine hydroxylase-related dioxygenase (phytanoyl-CoA dioxygenase family)